MKKVLALLIAFLMLGLAACGQKSARQNGPDNVRNEQNPTSAADRYYAEEDDFRWNEQVLEDGSIIKTRYSMDGIPLESIWENPSTGERSVIEYYADGNIKKQTRSFENTQEYSSVEYYENGSDKYRYTVTAGGSEFEEKISEAGYTTYLHNKHQLGEEEYFADDRGNLLKYVDEDGWVYEGDAIPAAIRDNFEHIKTKPAPTVEDSVTVQEADGSRLTTTTYADGTIVEERFSAENRIISRSTVYADGERYYEEYYESGRPKISITEIRGDTYEYHRDEEGYDIYYRGTGSVDMEILTDETGKVVKVLENGVEREDISELMKYYNFRSW